MKKLIAALVISGFFLGLGVPNTAFARDYDFDIDDGVYWAREDVDDLLSPELMRSLNLTRSQRSSLEELLHSSMGYGKDVRGPAGLTRLPIPGTRRPSGGRIVIEEKRDNLNVFLGLLGLGIMLSRMDRDPYYYDYIRIDDFLYMFFRILDMNQRRTFRIYFDRWYDTRYYSRPSHRHYIPDYHRYSRPDYYRHPGYDYDRYRRETIRELERRLRLSEQQRRRLDRELKDYYDRRREFDRRYRDTERDYLRRSFDRPPRSNIEEQRKELVHMRRQDLKRTVETRDRFRTILDDRQRRIFDAMRREDISPRSRPDGDAPRTPGIIPPSQGPTEQQRKLQFRHNPNHGDGGK